MVSDKNEHSFLSLTEELEADNSNRLFYWEPTLHENWQRENSGQLNLRSNKQNPLEEVTNELNLMKDKY